MTTHSTLLVLLLLAALLVADALWLHQDLPLFALRQVADFVEWLSFWR